MTATVITIVGEISQETQDQINEFIEYIISTEEVERVDSIGGGGFINHKPKK